MSTNERSSDHTAIPWLATQVPGFGTVQAQDDFLHPDLDIPDFTQTETYWFSFYVPERRLYGAVYCWMQKKLGSCTAGAWVYEGFKAHHLLSEYFNIQAHLPYPQQEGRVIRVPHVGLEIEVVAPLQQHALRYRDAAAAFALDLDVTALAPPAVRGNGFHFEQAMRIQGTLTLAGERIAVDSMSIRDRSWGQGRSEDPAKHPPLNWAVGVLDAGRTAFNLLGCDNPELHPGWQQRYGITPDRTLRDGWLYEDGVLQHVVQASQFVERERGGLRLPTGYRCDFETADGRHHRLDGRIVGQCPWGVWPNLRSSFTLVDWTLDGRSGWGDLQDSCWTEFLRADS